MTDQKNTPKENIDASEDADAKAENACGDETITPGQPAPDSEPDGQFENADNDDAENKTAAEVPNASDVSATSVRGKPWLGLLAILLVLILAAGLLYYVNLDNQRLHTQASQIAALTEQIANSRASTNETVETIRQGNVRQIDEVRQSVRASSVLISELENRVGAQAKRLRAMSDTSREDWLLAEVEYLLKLANQRVRIERSAYGAGALLEEADSILRDLDAPDLHSLRRAIAEDLAALRLMSKIDVEGIYLSLVAVTQQIENLPLRSDSSKVNQSSLVEMTLEEKESRTAGQIIADSFFEFLTAFRSYIRVTTHAEKPQVLAPESAVYLQQNLRLMLERAQLALLREQQDIYTQSIGQAITWSDKYFPKTMPLLNFQEMLLSLKDKEVVQDLPDIGESLNRVHEYIKNLHLLKSSSSTQPRKSEAG